MTKKVFPGSCPARVGPLGTTPLYSTMAWALLAAKVTTPYGDHILMAVIAEFLAIGSSLVASINVPSRLELTCVHNSWAK